MANTSDTRYAIVTGAGSGLGRALAVRLAERRYCVSLADVDVAGARETLQLVEQAGGRGRVDPLDVTQLDAWYALLEQLRTAWPRLDLLVNNAGVVAAGEIGSLPIAAWQRVIDVNLWGAIHGCHACAEGLKANPGSHVLNIASIIGLVGGPTMGPYAVSKAGVVALSETLRVELAKHRVGVTVVCPGFFATNLLQAGTFDEPAQQQFAESITRRARTTADDVARAALNALDERRFYVVLPSRARRLWWFKRWFPEAFLRRVERAFRDGVPRVE
ncbi:MAG: SDR family NAD(P)-dependent oxidoreductase [Planctomycetaceae bacterium]|nr:SDR family NAD(P)-dependent oxidoreductase [Planctomycetaceae bacterium]